MISCSVMCSGAIKNTLEVGFLYMYAVRGRLSFSLNQIKKTKYSEEVGKKMER